LHTDREAFAVRGCACGGVLVSGLHLPADRGDLLRRGLREPLNALLASPAFR
jgi:hypothetical protein